MAEPLGLHERDEALIAQILDRGAGEQGLLWDLRRIRSATLSRAILRRSIAPIVTSPEYRDATTRAARRLRAVHRGLVERATAQALAEIGVTLPDLDFEDLVNRVASQRSRTFMKEVDRATRKNLSRLVKNAGRRYRRRPSAAFLDELVVDMRPHLALTPKVSPRIARRVKVLSREGGLSPTATDRLLRRRQRAAISGRAKAAARHQIGVAVNTARHEAWTFAIQARVIKKRVFKRWVDQGDKRVRLSHRRQTDQGWIPFEEPYPVFGVMHPPAPEFGCRCYEEVKVSEFGQS